MPSEKSIVINLLQFQNACSPMDATLLGTERDFKLEHE